MKIKVIYVAYDGKRFDSPTECKAHENRAISFMNEFNDHVLLLDIMKRPIFCPTGFNIEGFMTWFHQAYGECSYININAELSHDFINFLDFDLGLIFPKNKVGLYKYDYDEDEWVSAD